MPPLRPTAASTLLLVVAAIGCTGPQRAFEEVAHAWEARRAYQAVAPAPMTAEVSRHFERGWRCGYTSVSLGRGGCPPAAPPNAYLGKKYQCPSGQQLVQLWYRGFAEGVVAARACGLGPHLVTNQVDCRTPCQAACVSPVSGVLPDPRVAMAGQYGAPSLASPTPAGRSIVWPDAPTAADPPVVGTEPEAAEPIDVDADGPAPTSQRDAGRIDSDLDYSPSETTPIVFPESQSTDRMNRAELIEAERLPSGSP